VRVVCLCIASSVIASTDLRAQTDDLQNLVRGLSEAIVDANKATTVKPRVRVETFRGLDGDANELGVQLANQLSDQLREVSATSMHHTFYVLDRIPDASPDAYKQPCDEKHPWPDILVKGSMDEINGRLSLRVTANRTSDSSFVFDRIALLPMDPAIEASMGKRLTTVGESAVWLRPGYDPDKDEESKASKGAQKAENITPPSCIYCARADYTDGARMAKIQGVVTLTVLIGKDGDPMEIEVVSGLPCGLNHAAIDAVKEWRLRPATIADGTPIAVWQEIEVTFQLY
jgi:TonB family protein